MATVTRKRKTASGLEASAKRLRIEEPQESLPRPSRQISKPSKTIANDRSPRLDDGDEDDNYKDDKSGSSDEEQTADTPVTPFSPGRKKFPSELKTIKCTWEGCTKTFNRPARLTAHLRSHTGERPFVCTYEGCDKAYLTDKHLQAHIKGAHTHEKNYKCDWEGCDKSFLTSTRLKRHKEAHEGHDRFRCTEYPPCNQTFRKHNTLQRHIRSDHLELAPYPCTHIDLITGEPCNAGFDGSVGLRKHEERVHGAAQFFCPQCTSGAFTLDGESIYLGFATDTQLQAHVRKEHANCPFCDLRCSSQRELRHHIENQHSGKSLEERKKITCTIIGCNKKFTRPGNLKIHMRTAHMRERYICGTFDVSEHPDVGEFDPEDACDKDFFSKASLIDHIRTAHLGLPSAVNKNRKRRPRAAKDEYEDDTETDSDEEYMVAPKKLRNRSVSQQPSSSMHITQDSIAAAPSPASSFESNFQYPAPATQGYSPAFGEVMGGEQMNPSFDQADIDWELQRRALEGGPFWVGADEAQNAFGGQQDEWTQEEMEMRRLVGDI